MNIKKISGMSAGIALLLAVAAPAWCEDFGSNWLEVRVVDGQSGSPVGQVAVCLGTAARADQFGARRAAADGTVRFSGLPVNRMVLTASRRGYQGRQQGVEPLSGNRVIVLKLVPGGGGPVCQATENSGEPEQASSGELEITGVRVGTDKTASSGAQVRVTVDVSGQANQIRIAESADFAGAAWQALKPQNPYTVSQGKGVKQLYIQVRRQVKSRGASIEVLSPTRVVRYRRY